MGLIALGDVGCAFEPGRAGWGGTEDVQRRLRKECNRCQGREVSGDSGCSTFVVAIGNPGIYRSEVV